MQREASICRGATKAPVGQASMQRVQLPQRSVARVRGRGKGSASGDWRPFGRHWSDRQGGDDDSEQQPGAKLLVDHAGVFADPADAGAGGKGALEDGAGVDVAACLAVGMAVQASLEQAQPGEQLVVVVGGNQLGVGQGNSLP